MKPITKAEATKQSVKGIPDFVIEVFNEAIVANLSNGSARITQDYIVKRIMAQMKKLDLPGNANPDTIFSNRWLDVEPLFRKAGWHVLFDKPAYCEDYAAYFIFS